MFADQFGEINWIYCPSPYFPYLATYTATLEFILRGSRMAGYTFETKFEIL